MVMDTRSEIGSNPARTRTSRPSAMADPTPTLLPIRSSPGSATSTRSPASCLFDARERLAVLLTDEDAATLKHLARAGMGRNTLRALASDLGYLEAWAQAATGASLPWPAPEALALKFVAHHLWTRPSASADPQHGMPGAVADALRARGLLRVLGRMRSRPSAGALPTGRPCIVFAVSTGLSRRRVCAPPCPSLFGQTDVPRAARAARAVTAAVIERLVATCLYENRLVDVRDRALLLVAFASGGRRRAEVAGLRVEDLMRDAPVPCDPDDPDSPKVTKITIRLGRTKTTNAEDDARVVVSDERRMPCSTGWHSAGSRTGPCSGASTAGGRLGTMALDPQSVTAILKGRCARAGLDRCCSRPMACGRGS